MECKVPASCISFPNALTNAGTLVEPNMVQIVGHGWTQPFDWARNGYFLNGVL